MWYSIRAFLNRIEFPQKLQGSIIRDSQGCCRVLAARKYHSDSYAGARV